MRKEENLKVQALYRAVATLIGENADLIALKVSDLTEKAGIGKGTAYEYFSTKEDIIASAIMFFTRSIVKTVRAEIAQRNSFQEKLEYVFSYVDQGQLEKSCFLKYLHISMGQDKIAQHLQERMCNEPEEETPVHVIWELVQCGKEEGVLSSQYPDSYLVSIVASKIVVYLLYMGNVDKVNDMEQGEFKKLLFQGLLRELGC